MAQSLMTEISAGLSTMAPWQLQAWYNGQFATQDPFMQYYNVSSDDIEIFYQIANSTTATIQPTAADSNYRDALTYRDTFAHDSPDYQLMDALGKEWYQYGSNPTAGNQQDITKWAENEIGTRYFINATPATQQKFMSYMGYAVTLTYYNYCLITMSPWGGSPQPEYIQAFAKTMRSIISGFLQTHPNPSQVDFQNYLNANANTDFCFQFDGLSSTDVKKLFTAFHLQSPHVYGAIDNAYSMAAQYFQQHSIDPSSPDGKELSAFFKILINAEATYDPNNPNVDLFKTGNVQTWIANLQESSLWNSLQPATQQLFIEIGNLEL
jgi:hypothetical protein